MLIVGIVPLLLILLGVAVLLGSSDQRRRVRSLPLSNTASVADGEVKLQGKAFAYEPLTAPLSGQACVLYRLSFSQWVGMGRNKRLEEVHRALVVGSGFAIIDAFGKLEIDAEGAELRCEKVHSGGTSLLGLDTKASAAVKEHVPHLSEGEVRVVEELIPDGETILVIGTVDTSQAPPKLGGPRLLLSRLSEDALTKWDSGDFAGIAMIVGGVAAAVALAVVALG